MYVNWCEKGRVIVGSGLTGLNCEHVGREHNLNPTLWDRSIMHMFLGLVLSHVFEQQWRYLLLGV